MKKTLLILTLILLGSLGFAATASAQEIACGDVVWSAETLADNPNIANACLDVVDKRGVQSVKLKARIVRQSVNSTIVQWQLPDGSWSSAQRRYPAKTASAEIGGKTVRISDLTARQEVNVYVPMGEAWSLPMAAAPAAAAAAAAAVAPPPAPAPAPAPEPEPEPMVLPMTATQVSVFALLGGLFILMGGLIGVARTRL